MRFPEGRVRLEDYDVNAQVIARGARVGVLASVPCYRWNLRGSASRNDAFDQDVYWASFDHSLLAVEEPARRRPARAACWCGGSPAGCSGGPGRGCCATSRRTGRRCCSGCAAPCGTSRRTSTGCSPRPTWPARRCCARPCPASTSLLAEPGRARPGHAGGHRAGAGAVARRRAVDHGRGRAARRQRRADGLRPGRRPAAAAAAPGVGTALDALDPAVRDVTQAVEEGAVDLVVRGREDDVEWALPTVGRLQAATDEATGRTHLRVHAEAVLDPADAALGAPLTDQIWSVQPAGRRTGVRPGHPAADAGRAAAGCRRRPGGRALPHRPRQPRRRRRTHAPHRGRQRAAGPGRRPHRPGRSLAAAARAARARVVRAEAGHPAGR
nr:hypothetical protein [Angustibacter aerolatus]